MSNKPLPFIGNLHKDKKADWEKRYPGTVFGVPQATAKFTTDELVAQGFFGMWEGKTPAPPEDKVGCAGCQALRRAETD
jgi:hypothetical protein